MAALTAATTRATRGVGYSFVQNHRVANSTTIYAGAYTALPGTNALTSSRGYLVPWQNEINLIWAGLAMAQSGTGNISVTDTVVGDTSASPVPTMAVESAPFIVERATVTGVSAQTDVGRIALYASNDNDLTTTANQAPSVGRVIFWYSSTTADVYFHGFGAAFLL